MPLYIFKETLAQIELILLLCVLYTLHRKKKYNPNEADWDHLLADEGQEKGNGWGTTGDVMSWNWLTDL